MQAQKSSSKVKLKEKVLVVSELGHRYSKVELIGEGNQKLVFKLASKIDPHTYTPVSCLATLEQNKGDMQSAIKIIDSYIERALSSQNHKGNISGIAWARKTRSELVRKLSPR